MRRLLTILLPALLAACARPDFPGCATPAGPAPVAWVVDHGWHTEIGLPADAITGPLAVYRTLFPGARTLMFGFGKRTFMTARVDSPAELLIGPLPGPAVVQVTALNVPPARAFPGRTLRLALPPDGPARLSDFLWHAIDHTEAGAPRLVADGLFPGSLFYGAARGYDLTYTCNSFTAEAMQQAGLAVDTDVILAAGTLRQAARITGACLAD